MKKLVTIVLLIFLAGVAALGQYTLMQQPPCMNVEGCDRVLMTWNVEHYYVDSETEEMRSWFSQALEELNPAILFIQEIANDEKIAHFKDAEEAYPIAVFTNTGSGTDNAIFFHQDITVEDLPDPVRDSTSETSFRHPPQIARFTHDGVSTVVISVHLTWGDDARIERGKERQHLVDLVQGLRNDGYQEFIVAGDFNTTEAEGDTIQGLADALGLQVLRHKGQDAVGTTYDSDDVNKYDYFLVSPGNGNRAVGSSVVIFNDLEMAEDVADHRPILACLQLQGLGGDAGGWITGAAAGGSAAGVVLVIVLAWAIAKRRCRKGTHTLFRNRDPTSREPA